MKLLITQVAYGVEYSMVFLEQSLKSFLDPSNIPAYKDRIRAFILFTDKDTKPIIERHPNWLMLKSYVTAEIVEFAWPPHDDKYNRHHARYGILCQTFKESLAIAIDRDCMLMALVADLVCAMHFMTNVFARMDEGHDAVFTLPLRSAYESIVPHLNKEPRAQTAMELCRLGIENLNPLWLACMFKAPFFTKLPFSLIWSTTGGLLVRSYSVTPIIFKPTKEMLKAPKGMIDVDIPAYFKNPFWATDFIHCGIIGVEFLRCFYPTFSPRPASVPEIKAWSKCLDDSQKYWLNKKLYYPSEQRVKYDSLQSFMIHTESDTVVRELTDESTT